MGDRRARASTAKSREGSGGCRRGTQGRGLKLLGAHEGEDEIGEQPEGDGGAEDEVQHGSGLRGPAGIAGHYGKEADADGEIEDVHVSGPCVWSQLKYAVRRKLSIGD